MDDWDGPFVTAAFFCDAYAKNNDGEDMFVAPTAGSVGSGSPDSYIETVYVLKLVGGRKRGYSVIEVFEILPDGSRDRVIGPNRILFDGPAAHVGEPLLVRIPAHIEGIIWYELVADGRTLTRTPMQVQHELPS